MNMLRDIMRRAATYPVDCWWLDPLASAVINHAHHLGLVYRQSVSQVEWTERGAELARKYSIPADGRTTAFSPSIHNR